MVAPDLDVRFMDRALQLARRGTGRTAPNPMVGAVIVSPEGVVVGIGYHERAGEPHAEINALRAAGSRAAGATLYCTLEPCSHVGRTGPCAPRVADAGIARVVAASEDANPAVAGNGLKLLRDRGVDVQVGLRRAEALKLNQGFFSRVTRRRPHVILKIACSLDGKVAARPGHRTAITSPPANRRTQALRAAVDALAVGSETVLVDDPLLTAREVWRELPLTRVILDRRLRTPPRARVLSTVQSGPVIIATTPDALAGQPDHASRLRDAGATVVAFGEPHLRNTLTHLAELGHNSLLLEGGANVHASAWREGVVDSVQVYVSSDVLGAEGMPWWSPEGPLIAGLPTVEVQPLGRDTLIEADVHRIG